MEVLVHAIEDTDVNVRQAAVQALGSLGKRAPVEVLVHVLDDTDVNVRQAAVQALSSLGERIEPDYWKKLYGSKNWTDRKNVYYFWPV